MTEDHSPVRNLFPALGTSDMSLTASTDNSATSSGSGQPSANQNVSEVSSIQNCKLPIFWKDNPEMWFLQAESVFQSFNVRADDAKYHLIVSNLTHEALVAVTDIIKSPPTTDKYNFLKAQLINRLADSADKQLHKALAKLKLGRRRQYKYTMLTAHRSSRQSFRLCSSRHHRITRGQRSLLWSDND